MSAQANYSRRICNPPDLPTEVWVSIFQLATHVPDLTSTDMLTAEFYRLSYKKRHKLILKSLVTKRYLIRVCKDWNAWATPILYESIFIGRGRVLSSLCATLQYSQRRAEAKETVEHSFGWYTKRMDVALRDHSRFGTGTQGHPGDFECFADIMRCMPNLLSLSFFVTISGSHAITMPPFVLRSIAETCGQSLQVINWYNNTLLPDHSDWQEFLRGCPNLRAIRCRTGLPHSLPDSPPLTPIDDTSSSKVLALPYLSTLHFHSEYGEEEKFFPVQDAPSLRNVIYDGTSPVDNPAWKRFLTVHGCRLTRIQLYDHGSSTLCDGLDMLACLCPNLTRLDISLPYWDWLGRDLSIPPSVVTLGLQCTEPQSAERAFNPFLACLESMKHSGALRVLQLTSPTNVLDLCSHHPKAKRKIITYLERINIEVEDHEGYHMT